MREKSWIGRRLPQIALALVCVAVLIGLVFVGICSKKMEAMIRHDSAMVKAQLQDAYREIQQCDEGSPEMGVAIERIWSNHSIPVIICDGEENITAVRNLRFDGDTADMSGFSERDLRRELRKIKESGDSITFDLGAGMRQKVYCGESHLVGYVWLIGVMPYVALVVFMILLCVGLAAFMTRKRRMERDNLWKGIARETAHQLGTPISGIMGWCDLLASGGADPKEVAENIGKDIERLSWVMDRFSHIEGTPNLKEESVNDDIRWVISYLAARVSRKVKLSLEEPDGEVRVRHDPTLLRWAIENLCKNAAQAISGSGAISITLSKKGAEHATIDIRDTGHGMDMATRKNVFEAGFSTKTGGWGLGLALVKRIVEENHNGRVYVLESKVGVGTTFRVEI